MNASDGLREIDDSVVTRYLQIRSFFHERVLGRIGERILEQFAVTPTRRIGATVVALLRNGFVRLDEGELWPVVFLTPVHIAPALCVQISGERLAELGTMLNGPQRIRERHWEDWVGWETPLASLAPTFHNLSHEEQEATILGWYQNHLDWLVNADLLQRR
jgi:hypothetical protein